MFRTLLRTYVFLLIGYTQEQDELPDSKMTYITYTLKPPSHLLQFNYLKNDDFYQKTAVTSPKEFSFMVWVKFWYFTSFTTLFSYANNQTDNVLIFYYKNEQRSLNLQVIEEISISAPLIISPANWIQLGFTHSCEETALYVDGIQIWRNVSFECLRNTSLEGALVIGQEQDWIGGGFSIQQSLCGEVVQPKIWFQILTKDQITEEFVSSRRSLIPSYNPKKGKTSLDITENFLGGKTAVPPSLSLDWSTFGDVIKTTKKISHGVDASFPGFVVPYKDTQSSAIKLCRYLGREVVTSHSRVEDLRIMKALSKGPDLCIHDYAPEKVVWLFIDRNLANGSFIDLATNEVATYVPEGDGLRAYDDQDGVLISTKRWLSRPKDSKFCSMCFGNFSNEEHYFLRDKNINNSSFEFSLVIDDNQVVSFHSRDGLIISYLNSNKWVLKTVYNNTEFGYLDADHFPIGRHQWTMIPIVLTQLPYFVNFSKDPSVWESRELTFSKCKQTQFTCDDGTCISMIGRCSGIHECEDLSDEFDCKLLHNADLDEISRVPSVNPLNIEVAAILKKFSNVNLKDQLMLVDVLIQFKWNDPRLYLKNLHNLTEINDEDLKLLWTPEIKVINSNVLDGQHFEAYGFTVQESEPIRISDDYVYSGESNKIILEYDCVFHIDCFFQLHWYPFDEQQCHVHLQISNTKSFSTKLSVTSDAKAVRNVSTYFENSEYTIRDFKVQSQDNKFKIGFALRRERTYHIFSTYFPVVLLHGIGYGTLYIRVDDFTNRGTMSLTTLLVLISLYTDKMSSLPVTSYLKYMDIWFIFSVGFLSAIIAVHLVTNDVTTITVHKMSTYTSNSFKRLSNKDVLKIVKVVFGIVYVTFVSTYYGVTVIF